MANLIFGGYLAFNTSLEVMNGLYFHDHIPGSGHSHHHDDMDEKPIKLT